MYRLLLSLFSILFSLSAVAVGEDTVCNKTIHRIEADFVPGGILHTNEYFVGDNQEGRTMNHATTGRLKYAFMSPENSLSSQVYSGAYQGVGLAFHQFNHQLGNPVSAFIYQGARIAMLSSRLSVNYEWNLGLAFGWKPYDAETNPYNTAIGSRVTAYIDADVYLAYRLSPQVDINAGISATHFSNGNTTYPNNGLNTLGARLSVAYYVNRRNCENTKSHYLPPFKRHWSYDLLLFGSWRRCGVQWEDGYNLYIVPGTFAVMGLNFSPMYNFNHWLRAGASLDYVYDRSANLYFPDGVLDMDKLTAPSATKQMAVGLSARAEFVMPYFSINFGIGKNVVNGHDDFSGTYEMLSLKLRVFRRPFINIGYCLSDFQYPNFLMLGVGYTFH